jgi:HK97 family phage major capsid protein
MQKRMNEIQERKTSILEEIKEADDVRLAELNEEVDALNGEEKELRSKMSIKDKMIPLVEERDDDRESRAREFMTSNRLAIPATETRAILTSTGSLAKPTEVGGINDPHNVVSSIVDMVAVEDLTGAGSYKEAYVKSWQAAGAAVDGTASDASDPLFRTAAINPFQIDVLTYVSKSIRKQTPLQYEAKVRQGALIALKKKAVNYIIKGNGSTAPFGIYHAANTETSPESITEAYEVTANTIDGTTLRKIVFAYGGDENVGAGARLFLNKLDLIKFGDVRGTNEKKAVYEIIPDGSNPNTGVIKDGGLAVPYVICSDVTALSTATYSATDIPTMIYGDPANYKLALFGDYEVSVSEDYKFAEGLLSVRGEAWIGGNVIVDKGFIVVTLTGA